jgi:hypothetical protein
MFRRRIQDGGGDVARTCLHIAVYAGPCLAFLSFKQPSHPRVDYPVYQFCVARKPRCDRNPLDGGDEYTNHELHEP